jgi:hypothetical protein
VKIIANKLYSVITGDVVGSSKLSTAERKRLLVVLNEASRAAQRSFGKEVPLPIDIFRGDSWQLVVTEPKEAIRIGLFLRAEFRATWGRGTSDTRLAIGIGTINFIPARRVSEGDGEAFRRSGSALEGMKNDVRMELSLPDKALEKNLNAIVYLIDTIAGRWTDKQARAVTGALRGLTQEEIASMWKPRITQQSVNRHLGRAGWKGIGLALDFINYSLNKL